MSFHTGGILIRKAPKEDAHWLLQELGFQGLRFEGFVDNDAAWSLSLGGAAVGFALGWAASFDPENGFGSGAISEEPNPSIQALWPDRVEEKLRQLSMDTDVFGFISEGFTSSYGLTWHSHGRRLRHYVYKHRAVRVDEGERLAVDPSEHLDQLPFSAVLLKMLRHYSFPFDAFYSVQFHLYSYTAPPT